MPRKCSKMLAVLVPRHNAIGIKMLKIMPADFIHTYCGSASVIPRTDYSVIIRKRLIKMKRIIRKRLKTKWTKLKERIVSALAHIDHGCTILTSVLSHGDTAAAVVYFSMYSFYVHVVQAKIKGGEMDICLWENLPQAPRHFIKIVEAEKVSIIPKEIIFAQHESR